MADEEPRPAELQRRIDDIGKRMDDGFKELHRRLEALPSNETILAYLEARDVDVRNIRDDVKDLSANLAKETAERRASMEVERNARLTAAQTDRDAATRTRNFTLTFGLSCLVGLVGVITFILTLTPGGTA